MIWDLHCALNWSPYNVSIFVCDFIRNFYNKRSFQFLGAVLCLLLLFSALYLSVISFRKPLGCLHRGHFLFVFIRLSNTVPSKKFSFKFRHSIQNRQFVHTFNARHQSPGSRASKAGPTQIFHVTMSNVNNYRVIESLKQQVVNVSFL